MLIGLIITIWAAKNGQVFEEDTGVDPQTQEETERVFKEISKQYPSLNHYHIIYTTGKILSDQYGICMPAMCLTPSKLLIIHSQFLSKNNSFDRLTHYKDELAGTIAHEMGHAYSNLSSYFLIFGTYTLILSISNLCRIGMTSLFELRNKLYEKASIILALLVDIALLVCLVLFILINCPLLIFKTPLVRREEYYADKFACERGYSEGLKMFFNRWANNNLWLEPLLDDFNHPSYGARLNHICDNNHYSRRFSNYIFSSDICNLEIYYGKNPILDTLPDSVINLGNEYYINSLSSITDVNLNHINKIYPKAFRNSNKLEKLTLNGDNIYIGEEAFSNAVHLKGIKFQTKRLEIADNAFKNCKELKDLTFICEELIIGDYAFSGTACNMLLILPGTKKVMIGKEAFFKTPLNIIYGLKEDGYTIMTRLGDKSFSELGDKVAVIHETAFNQCFSLLDNDIITHIDIDSFTQSAIIPKGAKIMTPSALASLKPFYAYIPDSVIFYRLNPLAFYLSNNILFKEYPNVTNNNTVFVEHLYQDLLHKYNDFEEILGNKKEELGIELDEVNAENFKTIIARRLKLINDYNKRKEELNKELLAQ